MNKFTPSCQCDRVARIPNSKGFLENRELGTVLYQPTHQLREVVEEITPEIPGKPVEPYVGLTWGYKSETRVVVEVTESTYTIAFKDTFGGWDMETCKRGDYAWDNYPKTPPTPAVTRTVRKWVPLTPEEVEQVQLDEAPLGAKTSEPEVSEGDGWTPWKGGECPVPGNTYTLRRYRDGQEGPRARAGDHWWDHRDQAPECDIIAYKVVK